MLDHTVLVTFTAPEHTGKTTLEAAFAKLLAEHGIAVKMSFDPQREDKMARPMEELLSAFKEKSIEVRIMESNAT